jgi:CxxC motif-containing protein (DUF1111 family)
MPPVRAGAYRPGARLALDEARGRRGLSIQGGEAAVHLYSDLLLHDMGVGLADDIVQGAAGPRDFRTAPLWGLGQRIFRLHDGRTTDLTAAIHAHASRGSEANAVVRLFDLLGARGKQDLLDFLRSL